MKRNEHYYLRNIAETFFLTPSDDIQEDDKKLVFLNETGVFLWEKLEKNCQIVDLEDALLDCYNVDKSIAHQHVADFISFLSENGCLELE